MWTNANAVHPNEDIGYWLGVYGALAAITLLGCLATDAYSSPPSCIGALKTDSAQCVQFVRSS